jgi:DNA-binding CsgD family transcriptional regulator
MSRTTVFTPEELADLSAELRQVRDIDDYCLHTTALLKRLFDCHGGWALTYHFFDGNIHVPGDTFGFRGLLRDWLSRMKFYEAAVWSGEEWMHSAANRMTIENVAEALEILEASKGNEFQVATWVLEDDVLLGLMGINRPLAAGDFSEIDLLNFRMLFPFWREGMRASAAYSRLKLLGGDWAAIVENHPSGLFLFDDADRLIYANHQAKLLLQNEPRVGSAAPWAELSGIPQTLVAQKPTGRAVLPLNKTAVIKQLPDWPELGLRQPWLAVVPDTPTELPLSERETEVLRAFALSAGAEDGAQRIGTTVSTFRTHLGNIAEKLGVSGSNAALTLWYLSGR